MARSFISKNSHDEHGNISSRESHSRDGGEGTTF